MNPFNLMPETKEVGTPGEIPDELGPECKRLTAYDVRKCLDSEELNHIQRKPGVCRFCRRQMPIAYTDFGTIRVPVLQCDRAARLWNEAESIKQNRFARAEAARKEAIAKAAKPRKPEEWEGSGY